MEVPLPPPQPSVWPRATPTGIAVWFYAGIIKIFSALNGKPSTHITPSTFPSVPSIEFAIPNTIYIPPPALPSSSPTSTLTLATAILVVLLYFAAIILTWFTLSLLIPATQGGQGIIQFVKRWMNYIRNTPMIDSVFFRPFRNYTETVRRRADELSTVRAQAGKDAVVKIDRKSGRWVVVDPVAADAVETNDNGAGHVKRIVDVICVVFHAWWGGRYSWEMVKVDLEGYDGLASGRDGVWKSGFDIETELKRWRGEIIEKKTAQEQDVGEKKDVVYDLKTITIQTETSNDTVKESEKIPIGNQNQNTPLSPIPEEEGGETPPAPSPRQSPKRRRWSKKV